MPRTKPIADWTSLIVDASGLWADASMVVAPRSSRMIYGGLVAAR